MRLLELVHDVIIIALRHALHRLKPCSLTHDYVTTFNVISVVVVLVTTSLLEMFNNNITPKPII